MSKELVVSSTRHETRVAILEDDQLVEIFHEREKEYSLAGSIHKGRVTRVLPGMQSAFVDIGLERDAFLYVSDFFEDNDEYDAVVSTVEEKILRMDKGSSPVLTAAESPRIEDEPAPVQAVAEGAAATATVEARQQGNRDQRNGSSNSNDRGARDRDRRGRRGRRRGGRGNGGIPESKYAPPRSLTGEETEAAAAEDSHEDPDTPPAPPFDPSAIGDDLIVLPGESLRKYSRPEAPAAPVEPPVQSEEEIEEFAQELADAVDRPIEYGAIPLDHPFAGFGAAAAMVREPEPVVEVVPEAEPASAVAPVAEVEPQRIVEALAAVEEPAAVVETEVGTLVIEQEEGPAAALEIDAEFPAEPEDQLADEAPEDGEAVSEEGPEPARIPTSLTATLREQDRRQPHRVSRRMRRRNRGDRGGDRPQQQGSERPPAAEATATGIVEETKVVEPREEGRPERGGRERGERTERAERGERAERPERGERGERTERGERGERKERERPPLPSISDLLKEGQEIIVQIAKEPIGQKGARITSHIALPGRFVVYMPTVDHAGVSRKIPSDEERQRLKRIIQTHRQGIPGGYICRTAAEGKTEEELQKDMHFLYNLWLDMRQKAEKRPAPMLLHHDLDLVQRILRDQLTTSFKTIWVDSEELYESVLRFAERFQPALVSRVKLYTRPAPIFDEFGVTAEIEKALRPKVWLKSGGYIVINQTEALVAIDINTGKYVGKSNRLEDTIVKINTDAIKEIVRQIRIRDLGGIIVVDFIDMDDRKNRQKVMQALEEAMRVDRAPYKILQFNDFGLVAITRKRVKQSLERTLCSPCPYCEGAGHVKNATTVVAEILTEATKMRKAFDDKDGNVVLRVNPEVGKVLKNNRNQFLQEIEETLGRAVLVKSDPQLHQSKFDLA